MSKFPVSFSRLSTFESCPTKFEYLYVTKQVSDPGNEYTLYGTRVHEAIEHYCRKTVSALPDDLKKHKRMLDNLLSKSGDKYFEYQMAITSDKEVCDWFATEVWLRGVADVLIVDGDKAWCLDWKTGKVKDDPTQLKLFALLVMIHFPKVMSVNSSYVWLAHNEVTKATYTRDMYKDIWVTLDPRFDAVEEAYTLGVFKPSPSRLCNWCPAKNICGSAKR